MAGGIGGTALNQTNERLSAGLTRYQPGIADNIKTRNVLLDFFSKRKETFDGGTELGVRFRYKKMAKLGEAGNHVGVYRYYDQLNTSPSDTIKTGRETWSNMNVPIALSHQEQRENKGQKQFDRLKEKTEEAMDNLAENVNDVWWGVAGGDQSILPTPMTTIVSGSDAGTIHGLSKASNTWLYSQESTSIGDAATYLFDKMTTGFNLTVDNAPSKSDKLDLFITDRATYEVLQSVLPSYLAYPSSKDVDFGFPSFKYMGVNVAFDSTCPLDSAQNHQIYGLMSKYWTFAIDSEMNFKTTKFYDRLPDQASDVAQLFLSWAVLCNNPRTNWRGNGITIS